MRWIKLATEFFTSCQAKPPQSGREGDNHSESEEIKLSTRNESGDKGYSSLESIYHFVFMHRFRGISNTPLFFLSARHTDYMVHYSFPSDESHARFSPFRYTLFCSGAGSMSVAI